MQAAEQQRVGRGRHGAHPARAEQRLPDIPSARKGEGQFLFQMAEADAAGGQITDQRSHCRAEDVDAGNADQKMVERHLGGHPAEQRPCRNAHASHPLQAPVDRLAQGRKEHAQGADLQELISHWGVGIDHLVDGPGQDDQTGGTGKRQQNRDQQRERDGLLCLPPPAHRQRRRDGRHQHSGKSDVQRQRQVEDGVALGQHTG